MDLQKDIISLSLCSMRFPQDIEAAILREKQIKSGWRQKKIDLINNFNRQWKDLYECL